MNDTLAKEAVYKITEKFANSEGELIVGNIRKAILEAKEALSLLESLEYYQSKKVA